LGDAADTILPGRQGLWDTAQIMTSLRKDTAGRLMIGSMGRVMGDARTRHVAPLGGADAAALVSRHSGRWGSRRRGTAYRADARSPAAHPQAGRGALYAIGYNGRGITTGTVFGKAMAELLTGMNPADLPLPMSECAPIAAHPCGAALRGRLCREPDHERVGTMSDATQIRVGVDIGGYVHRRGAGASPGGLRRNF
jgi:glycine/D-amino acid oxidase-like deaminating enzyme